jgi:hypothetical protein
MTTAQARSSVTIMGLDTHMILETVLVACSARRTAHHVINRSSRHYAEAVRYRHSGVRVDPGPDDLRGARCPSVRAQHRQIVTALEAKFPAAAGHLDDAREDILAFTAFPGRSGTRCGAIVRRSARIRKYAGGPMLSAYSPPETRSSASSAPFLPSRTMNGPRHVAIWGRRSSRPAGKPGRH